MACNPEILKSVPLFSLLDDEERSVLAGHIEVKHFAQHHRIYRAGDANGRGYVVVHGRVRVTLIDIDEQEVPMDEPEAGGFFGFASLLDGSPHQTSATALTPVTCLEIDREDLRRLLFTKPDAGMDMLAVVGRQFHATQQLVRDRSMRNPNEMIDEKETFGERVADSVAKFGGSWTFIIIFFTSLVIYTAINERLGAKAWDPYPYILLNLVLSMLAAVQAPVIMMSQNRQDAKDRLRSELDYEVNRRAEREIQRVSAKLREMSERLADVEEKLESRPS
jgi:CRP/FNR family transcriptional regulator, cyclic AMP receptor protein